MQKVESKIYSERVKDYGNFYLTHVFNESGKFLYRDSENKPNRTEEENLRIINAKEKNSGIVMLTTFIRTPTQSLPKISKSDKTRSLIVETIKNNPGMTQQKVANLLGLSRQTVVKKLREARSYGEI